MKEWTIEEARLHMADLCARSEQCRFDIRRKLLAHGLSSKDAERVLDFLEDGRFLDESRYARAFTGDKLRFSGWGRLKIRQALRCRMVPERIVEKAIGDIDEEEYVSILRKVVAAKSKGLDLDDRASVARVVRSVMSRGFEPALICKVMGI